MQTQDSGVYTVWDATYNIAPAVGNWIAEKQSQLTGIPIDHSRDHSMADADVCFTKGTLVFTIEGLKPIEEIKVGDSVLSYNIKMNSVESSVVVNTLNRQTQSIYEITAGKEIIYVTSEHPFYVVGKGWVKVKDLHKNDMLKSSYDKVTVEIKAIKQFSKTVTVYNMEVDGNHNYFVTPSSILVHNKKIKDRKYKNKK